MRLSLPVTLIALSAAAPALAEESAFVGAHSLLDPSPQQRHQQLSFWAEVPWDYGAGIGVGVRYAIPVVENGFIPKINNSFEIEFGGDIGFFPGYAYCVNGISCYGGSGYDIGVVGEARWTFHFTPRFSAYGKVGLGLGYFGYSYAGSGGLYTFHPIIVAGPGIIFYVSDKISLRAELGYPTIKGGIGIDF